MRLVLEDYVNAELEQRYPDIEAFKRAWGPKFGKIIETSLAPNENEFFLGIESAPDIVRTGSVVEISEMQTAEIGGILKLMLLKYPTEIKVTGETGP